MAAKQFGIRGSENDMNDQTIMSHNDRELLSSTNTKLIKGTV